MKRTYIGSSLALWLGLACAQAPGPLVDAAWVAENGCRDQIRVLDIRSQTIDGEAGSDYALGHIPCAVHTDYARFRR